MCVSDIVKIGVGNALFVEVISVNKIFTKDKGVINMNEQDLLKLALENGILDIQHIQHEIQMRENEKYLNQHPYSIWEGKNGKHYTYIQDDDTDKRKLVKRNTKEEIEKVVIDYWKSKVENPTLL